MIEPFSFLLIILIAIFGSFGHCIGMCGGVVVAYSTAKIDRNYTKTKKVVSHLLYNIGRILSYTFIAALLGWTGGIFFELGLGGLIGLISGFVMVLFALYLAGISSIFNKLEYDLSKTGYFKNIFAYLIKSRTQASFFGLGMLTGLLPCGFANFFFAFALSSGSALQGGTIGALFGLFTVPLLFYIGISNSMLREAGVREIALKITALFAFMLGGYTLLKGFG